MSAPADPDLMLFKEQWPDGFAADRASCKSECPPDKKIKIEDLFQFKRGRGDLHVSLVNRSSAAATSVMMVGAI